MKRREFIKSLFAFFLTPIFKNEIISNLIISTFKYGKDKFGMVIDISKCIGCGRCVSACKEENDVPEVPFYFRTWIERYLIFEDGEVYVESPNGGMDGFKRLNPPKKIAKSFFIPKLCNQCEEPPCVQVCPVGATYETDDGVVLIDKKYCIGCGYCVQACPYGARYFHPKTQTPDKCTFCYHRIKKGLLPVCVTICPQNARIFGKIDDPESPVYKYIKNYPLQVLKPHLRTHPKVYYKDMDMEVR